MKIRAALEQAACLPPRRGTISGKADLSLQDGLARLAQNPDLVPIAGGTDLVVRAGHALGTLQLFSLEQLDAPELHQVFGEDGNLVIGA